MAGTNYSLELNDRDVMKALNQLIAKGKSIKPAMRQIGEHLLSTTQDRFSEQVSPDGTPWVSLNDKYKQHKKQNKDKVLILSDHLRGEMAYNPTEDSIELVANQGYAATHQFGDDRRNIPARPFLGLTNQNRDRIIDILRDHLIDD